MIASSRMGLALRAFTLCLALGLGWTTGWATDSSLNDSAAREHLEEMERTGVVRDVPWANAYWNRSRSAPTVDARISDLRWALSFDPYLTLARWELSAALIRARDPEFALHAILALKHCTESFTAQQRVAMWVITLASLSLAGALACLSIVAVLRAAPSVAHAVRERLYFLPPEVRTGALVLTMCIPLVLVVTLSPIPALFWLILLGTTGTWTMLGARERSTCASCLVALALLPVAFAAWTRVAQGTFPESYLQALWDGQLSAEGIHATLGTGPQPSSAVSDPDYHATLALLDRRAGRYDSAARHLERAVSLDPTSWAYRNNLGNIRLLKGDTDTALEAYAAAQSLAPNEPLVRVNQAQAWVGKMNFTQADNALTEAVRMGYRLPHLLTSDPLDVVVRDHTLSARELWMRQLRDQPPQGALSWIDALRMSGSIVAPLRPIWLMFTLLFALYYVSLARKLPRVQSCSGCGTKVCRKCHYRVQRRSLCRDCWAIRGEIQAPLKRQELMGARRSRRSRLENAIAILASLLVPGAGFYLGRAYRAAVVAAVAIVALWLVATAGVTFPDPVAELNRVPAADRALPPLVIIAALSLMSLRAGTRRPRFEEEAALPPAIPHRPTRGI